ncbi:MAG: ABC transporter permease [Desulfohalobiaceae bacterium]
MFDVPIGEWIESLVENFLLRYFTEIFDFISYVVGAVTSAFEGALQAIPPGLFIAIVAVLAFWRLTWRYTLVFLIALLLLLGMGMWQATISTLSLVVTATVISLIFAIPLGIWMSKSDRVEGIVRPILDFMQTMPPFVYLIPAAMLFGLGKVPGAVATITFCTPPAVRLTNLGIRQVPKELKEAALAFGCTPMQLLRKVEIPIAMPSIMAGVNQNIMMALSMVVIASMIGAGGLGNVVLSGIQRMNIGLGFEGGLGVVILAIILDRITQSFSQRQMGFLERFRRLFKGELA